MTFRGGFGGEAGPRTYIQASETEDSNLRLPIKLAISGALAIDAILLFSLAGLLMAGEWMLPIAGGLAGLSVYVALRLFTNLWTVRRMEFWTWAFAACVTMVAVGFGEREHAWAWAYAGLEGLWQGIEQLLSPFSWWWPLLLVLIWVIAQIKKQGKTAVVFNAVLTLSWVWKWFSVDRPQDWGWITFGQPWTWIPLALFWDRFRWMAGFLIAWPWMLFGLVLAIRFVVEVWSGNTLPLTLMPAEVKDITFWDILFPGLVDLKKVPNEAAPNRQWVSSETKNDAGRTQVVSASIPKPSRHENRGHIGYYLMLRDLVSGVIRMSWLFNVGKRVYGYKQAEYRGYTKGNIVYYGMRAAFEKLGYGEETDDKKWTWHESFYEFAVPTIVRKFGIDAVPLQYRKYATSPPP